jgi:predicted RNA polymerase sigma factor
VHRLLPEDSEVAGLLALMLLTDARRPARTDAGGELIPLEEQDRTLWDRALIAEGTALIDSAVARVRSANTSCRRRSPHCTTGRAGRGHRLAAGPCPVRVAGTHDRQPGGLAQPGDRGGDGARPGGRSAASRHAGRPVAGHYRLDAVRAHFYEMAGDVEAAVTHYRAAAGRTTSTPEQRYLATRAARLRASL